MQVVIIGLLKSSPNPVYGMVIPFMKHFTVTSEECPIHAQIHKTRLLTLSMSVGSSTAKTKEHTHALM